MKRLLEVEQDGFTLVIAQEGEEAFAVVEAPKKKLDSKEIHFRFPASQFPTVEKLVEAKPAEVQNRDRPVV